MRLNNGTTDPVDYEQTGGGPQSAVRGTLTPAGTPDSSTEFPPSGVPPFQVVFTFPPDSKDPLKEATASNIPNDDSTVRLCPDWTTAVDRKCSSP